MNIDSYDSPTAEALLLKREERLAFQRQRSREVATNLVAAGSFLTIATLLAVEAHPARPLSIPALVLVVAGWVVAERIRFPAGSFATAPPILAFVPALFLLPTPDVPLIAAGVLVLLRVPDLVR